MKNIFLLIGLIVATNLDCSDGDRSIADEFTFPVDPANVQYVEHWDWVLTNKYRGKFVLFDTDSSYFLAKYAPKIDYKSFRLGFVSLELEQYDSGSIRPKSWNYRQLKSHSLGCFVPSICHLKRPGGRDLFSPLACTTLESIRLGGKKLAICLAEPTQIEAFLKAKKEGRVEISSFVPSE